MTRPQFHIIGTEKDAETVDVAELYDLIHQYQFKHRKRKLNRLPALAEMLKIAVGAEYVNTKEHTKQSEPTMDDVDRLWDEYDDLQALH